MKITFKKFIQEATVSDSPDRIIPIQLGLDQDPIEGIKRLVGMLSDKCSYAFNSFVSSNGANAIFRGDDVFKSYAVEAQFDLGIRKSQNTSDIYRMVIDTNPAFSEYPKRNASMIATTDENYADSFGTVIYIVFPFDNTPIAFANSFDMFDKDVTMFGKEYPISSFSRNLAKVLFNESGFRVSDFAVTPELFIDAFDKLGVEEFVYKYCRDLGIKDIDGIFSQVDKYHIKDGKSFLKYLHEHVLTPEVLGFSLSTPQQFYTIDEMPKHRAGGSSECWIGGKCILVRYSLKHDILHQANLGY